MKWGIGKKVFSLTLLYTVIVYLLNNFLSFSKINLKEGSLILKIIGILLVLLGLLLYFKVLLKIKRYIKSDKLSKEGAYRAVRHPIYSIWAFLILPGFCLIINNLLFYTIPAFLIILLLLLIPEEEKELERKFKKEFLEYKKEVPMLFPTFNSITGILFYPEFTKVIKNELYIIKEKYANFFIYRKGETYIAIDSGIGSKIGKNELGKLNIPLYKINAIFFTHSDFDHINGRKFFPNAELFFCEGEEKIIKGKKPRFLKIIYVKKNLDGYKLLKDSEITNIRGIEIKAISTSGHTPGHCTYLVDNKYLFTGDLIRVKEGKIYPFYEPLSYNHKDLLKSYNKIKKILESDNLTVFTAHHGIYNNKIL